MDALMDGFAACLGRDQVIVGQAAAEHAFSPWTRLGVPRAVLRPSTTEEVSAVMRIAHAARASVVPWGGRTGLVEGANADGAIALSFERMRAVEEVDRAGATMTVQAGCTLDTACRAADEQGLLLPLDFGARGTATLGGAIATNAGGNRVVRYGMVREMVLGLEAVLADGTVIPAMNHLLKNNAGYDLKQLFIGSEGTLGLVTRAVLRLRPKPASQVMALLSVERFDALAPLLRTLETKLAGTLSAFEVMWPEFYALVTTPPAAGRPILPGGQAYYVLVEALGADMEADSARFLQVLGQALNDGLVVDAAIAKSQAERDRMWALRDDVGQTGRHGPVATFDVGLPISAMEAYVAEVRAGLRARWPDATLTVFGHLGDGNLHLIASLADPGARGPVEQIVYAPLGALGGTISAEHGIGLQKRAHLGLSRTPEEVALMRTLKTALDPLGLLNPGKVLA
ncbi:MAG TPA: FAD-binding oxidoreductase [Phenylobacterium sp.]|nr:FAD-binding oxidoreductase [Phenylobacterium sp.]